MNESKKAVLLGMSLLGVTNAERAAYQNVKDGKKAWDGLVKEKAIIKEGAFYRLSPHGRALVATLMEQQQRGGNLLQ
jgi:hypothetical protein